jgi:hypothetical protein
MFYLVFFFHCIVSSLLDSYVVICTCPNCCLENSPTGQPIPLDWGLCTPKQKKKRKKNYLTSCHALCFRTKGSFQCRMVPSWQIIIFLIVCIWGYNNLAYKFECQCPDQMFQNNSCQLGLCNRNGLSWHRSRVWENSHQNGLLLDYRMFFPVRVNWTEKMVYGRLMLIIKDSGILEFWNSRGMVGIMSGKVLT